MNKSAYPIRTRFAKDIIAEVMLPEKQPASTKRKRGEQGKIAILATGLPSSPNKTDILLFLAAQGYIVISPRYRGTWESQGKFLAKSPAQDIRDIIDDLMTHKSIVDLFTGETKHIRVSAIHLFGSSFGGPAVLMNSHLPIVKKVIALSPVIDWKVEGESEPFDFFVRFTKEAFGDAFRPESPTDWQKLLSTDFYNPIAHTKTIQGKKVFIMHAKDDTVVPCDPLVPFAEKINAAYYLKPKGGHFSLMFLTHQFFWKKIQAFIDKR